MKKGTTMDGIETSVKSKMTDDTSLSYLVIPTGSNFPLTSGPQVGVPATPSKFLGVSRSVVIQVRNRMSRGQ